MSKLCGIYLVTHIETGRHYVGQSINIAQRWAGHCAPSAAKRGHLLGCAIRKYGRTAFTFQILEECAPEQLDAREAAWLAEFDCMAPRGFNLAAAGQAAGRTPHAASREKMSQARKDYLQHSRDVFHKQRGYDTKHEFQHVDGRCVTATCTELKEVYGCDKPTYVVSGIRDQANGWMLATRVAELRKTKPFIFRLTYEHADGRRVQATIDEMRKLHGANHHISSLHKGRLHTSQGWKLITEEA